MFLQNFIKLRAAVHKLSCKKLRRKQYGPSLRYGR